MRISYARQDDVLEVPNLIEIQKDSYNWFLEEGLAEVFEDISPIEDYSDQLSLEFVDYQLCNRRVQGEGCDICGTFEGEGKALQ